MHSLSSTAIFHDRPTARKSKPGKTKIRKNKEKYLLVKVADKQTTIILQNRMFI